MNEIKRKLLYINVMTSYSKWTNQIKDSFKNMQYQYRAPDFGLYTKKIHVSTFGGYNMEKLTNSHHPKNIRREVDGTFYM